MRFSSLSVLAVGLRLFLYLIPGLQTALSGRVEIASPVTSSKRMTEGVFLAGQGLSPYSGFAFHHPPLLLLLFSPLASLPPFATQLLFIVLDVLTCLCLRKIATFAKNEAERADRDESNLSNAASSSSRTRQGSSTWVIAKLPDIVSGCYLLNPLTMLSCVGLSTASLTHLSVAAAIALTTNGQMVAGACALGLSVYLDVYPVFILVPLILLGLKVRRQRGRSTTWRVCLSLLVFALTLGALLQASHALIGDWVFLTKGYGAVFLLSDLTPNVGVFWYFFTELFPRFRAFFLVLFHSHPAFYGPAIVLRFHTEPLFAVWALFAISCVFRAYPTIADTAFFLCLLIPSYNLLAPRMRRVYPVVYLMCQSMAFGALMWFLWIYPGSGNANFVYFQTLLYVWCASFLIVEALGSVRRLKADEAALLKTANAVAPPALD